MSPEIYTALVGLIVTIIVGIGSFITTIFYMVKKFGEIKVEQEQIKNDAKKQDNAKDDIINTFVVDFNKRLEDKDDEVKELRELLHQNDVKLSKENSELQGKITAFTEAHNKERDSWNIQRQEMNDKIEKLERQITELTREKELNIEEIRRLRTDRDNLKKRLEERDRLVLDQSKEISDLDESLRMCRQEKDKAKKKTGELQSQITELKQPKDKKDVA